MTAATRSAARAAGPCVPLAELAVYQQAPGVVARCTSCQNVLLVIVQIRGIRCVDLLGIAAVTTA